MTEISPIDIEERGKRPSFLKVLCILTFVVTGFGILTSVTALMAGPASDQYINKERAKMAQSATQMDELGAPAMADWLSSTSRFMVDANNNHYVSNSSQLLIAVLGLMAALRMWAGYKIGFHLYIGYCLMGILLMYTYASPANIHYLTVILSLLFSLLFIFMYSRNLKWMTK